MPTWIWTINALREKLARILWTQFGRIRTFKQELDTVHFPLPETPWHGLVEMKPIWLDLGIFKNLTTLVKITPDACKPSFFFVRCLRVPKSRLNDFYWMNGILMCWPNRGSRATLFVPTWAASPESTVTDCRHSLGHRLANNLSLTTILSTKNWKRKSLRNV